MEVGEEKERERERQKERETERETPLVEGRVSQGPDMPC
jgi:hypothetical protein